MPVYNGDKYIKDCLDSIVNQTLNEIEIICVNDGSTDNTLNILNEYASNDNRFKIISQDNQGQGAARNNGMQYINGEYFCFVDSDDKLELNTIEHCYITSKKKNLDIVMYKLINYDDKTGKYYKTPGYDMYRLEYHVKDTIFNYKTMGEQIFYTSVSPVNKLYNSHFVLDNNVKFPEGTIFEDNIFFWKLLFKAQRMYFIKEYYYVRRVHGNSVTKLGNKQWVDAIDIYNKVWSIFKENNYFEKYKSKLYNNKLQFALFRYDNINEKYKQFFFEHWKQDLINIQSNYYDFEEKLNEKNKLVYQIVLSSNNSNEFDLLMNIKSMDDIINKVDYKNKEIKFIFSELTNKINELEEELNNIHDSNNNREYQLLTNLESLDDKLIELEEELNKLKKFKDETLSSNSWKLTEPLRKFRQFVKFS